ncbi:TPA: hypothetical protein DIC40_05130 [Patescibacteria group bacterium]|nr:hypothetical protein P148_SR1C00001G0606 [candidate division SR1 bacterium RAAC1_SR1_1]HCY21203.1 hypothetical protein [Candidatus Gracilibacteria bacterium]
MDKKDKAFVLGAILLIGGILSILIIGIVTTYFDFLLNTMDLRIEMPGLKEVHSSISFFTSICLILIVLGALITALNVNKK